MGELVELLKFYRENGPSCMAHLTIPSTPRNMFGLDGYLTMLVGNRAPYEARYQATDAERAAWNQMRATMRSKAGQGVTVAEMLKVIRTPQWQWPQWTTAASTTNFR